MIDDTKRNTKPPKRGLKPNSEKLVFIFGPTAVGKTEIACEIAEGIGEVVSVDSMQVYKGLELGTAKPTAEQLFRVRHHLVSIVPPEYRFSAGDFKRLAHAAVNEAAGRGKVPFLVGGTGLYFRAFEYGLADAPPADAALREKEGGRVWAGISEDGIAGDQKGVPDLE
jgi:tRNA dimethylallyltransferase